MLKKLVIPILIFVFCFSGCGNSRDLVPSTQVYEEITATGTSQNPERETLPQLTQFRNDTDESDVTQPEAQKNLFRAAWISYYELTVWGRSKSEYTEYLNSVFLNMKEIGITDVFLHVRAFADAVYESELFPSSQHTCGEQGAELPFDVLELALKLGAEHGMNIHAWINPYRASFSSDVDALCDSSKVKQWINQNSENVALVGERYYFNPACEEVRRLIIDGVREILQNYPEVKGIHIDDYFYPENCGDFDAAGYNRYTAAGGNLSLSDWRRENVNSLVSGIYSAVKSFGSDKIFSVSPAGNINNCYNMLYADVEKWCSLDGYCDMIIPQIYFGFNNEAMPFESTVDQWISLCENSKVKLVIGLALYKCGQYDEYAGSAGENEWIENSDIIKRQVQCIKNKNLYGFSLFSSSHINFSKSFLKNELEGLKSVL